jgi:hypothetical protein
MYYYEGFAGEDCSNNICTYKADYILDEFRGGPKGGYKKKNNYSLIPKGVLLKVVGSYMIESDELLYRLFNNPLKKVIIELPTGKTAEQLELGFDLDVIRKRDENYAEFLPTVNEFRKTNYLEKWYCLTKDKSDRYSFFGNKVRSIIDYYGLGSEVKVKRSARSRDISKGVSCLNLKVSDLEAFIIFKHRLRNITKPVDEYFFNRTNELCKVKSKQDCLNIKLDYI